MFELERLCVWDIKFLSDVLWLECEVFTKKAHVMRLVPQLVLFLETDWLLSVVTSPWVSSQLSGLLGSH